MILSYIILILEMSLKQILKRDYHYEKTESPTQLKRPIYILKKYIYSIHLTRSIGKKLLKQGRGEWVAQVIVN